MGLGILSLLNQTHLPAASLCARAMLDNPLRIRVFGNNTVLRERRLRRFFATLLSYVYRKGQLYGAFVEQELVGVLGMLPPGHCKPTTVDILRLAPGLMRSTTPLGLWHMGVWLGTWAKIDPATPHWHIGPLAVHPEWQRQGIGTQLLEFMLNHTKGAPRYLETDKLSNVQLYEKLGFSVLAQPVILGVESWVMEKGR